MKKILNTLALAAVLLSVFQSCGPAVSVGKTGSSGKTLEMLIVCKNSVYSSLLQSSVDSIFLAPQDGLNQPEQRFDVVQIVPSSFTDNKMFQAHRNLLILDVDPQGLNKVFLEYDKWATPQVVIRFTAKDVHSLDSMLFANKDRLLKEYYGQEYRRMAKVFSKSPDVQIINKIKSKYGYTLAIPEEFVLATMKEDPNFTWVFKQTKDFDLHLFLNKAKGTTADLTEENILANADTMLHRFVPGPTEGSYPGVERRDFFYTRQVKIGDIDAVEVRGLWRTYNDFMGGPFVSYSFISPSGDEVYTLMACVYSPSQRNKMVMKRDLLMQLDGICRSISFED